MMPELLTFDQLTTRAATRIAWWHSLDNRQKKSVTVRFDAPHDSLCSGGNGTGDIRPVHSINDGSIVVLPHDPDTNYLDHDYIEHHAPVTLLLNGEEVSLNG